MKAMHFPIYLYFQIWSQELPPTIAANLTNEGTTEVKVLNLATYCHWSQNWPTTVISKEASASKIESMVYHCTVSIVPGYTPLHYWGAQVLDLRMH